jgi:phosphoserine aminotransferase
MVYNFSPGPAMLPPEVLKKAHAEFFNWKGLGASIMEISHRGADFTQLIAEIEQDCRDLLNLPSHYQVLFLSGGARAQFAAIPLNLAAQNHQTAYVVTGMWGKIASEEAKRYSAVKVVASNEHNHYTSIPPIAGWEDYRQAAYLHYTENETVQGIEFSQTPQVEGAPLICDMSSSIMSRPLDLTRFGLVYAGTQKNLGIAGLTLVIVRDDLAARAAQAITPSIFNYALQIKNRSLYNTPPVFPWYITGLVFKWLKEQGGLGVIGERNQRKAAKLYQYIDETSFYTNPVRPADRSRMNVIFSLPDAEIEKLFISQSQAAGFIGLKGHSSQGGIRVSLYNAMPEAGVNALIEFMREFAKQYG